MQTVHKTHAVEAVHHEDNSKGTDGSATDNEDPWDPPRPPFPTLPPDADMMRHLEISKERARQLQRFLAEHRATKIIAPDRTPQSVLTKFCGISHHLGTILEKDCVRRFLHVYRNNVDRMVWGLVITPQTLNFLVAENALRCAKVVLEGKASVLCGQRANPNYMTNFGYFPLHQAAETFSIEMIELLLRYGASANLRTSGNKVIEGLLPLHVAIENTCMHKYLEDNLLTDEKHNQANFDFIYKLIHLLCLPEMKIFLDTTRLLANHTDNVVDELWNYIKDGKLVHTAILLLAAQRQIRMGGSCKRNGNSKLNGFDIIKDCIVESMVSLETEGLGLVSGKNGKARKQLEEKRMSIRNGLVLVIIFSRTGEALDAYIQTRSEVSHQEVLESVSSILRNYGFAPSGKGIDIGDLHCCPYDCGMSPYDRRVSDKQHGKHGDTGVTEAAIESPNLNVEAKNAVGKKLPSGQDLVHTRRMFFPHWRSVLTSRFSVRVFPSYVPKKERVASIQQFYMAGSSRNKWKNEGGSSPVHVGLLGRTPQLASNNQSRRLFGTAAFTLLKMLKRA